MVVLWFCQSRTKTTDDSNISLLENSSDLVHIDMNIGTAAYLYALRATPSAPHQTTDLVSISRVRMPDRANMLVCKTPSRFIVRIHEIIPPWYRAIAANIQRYRLLQSRVVSFRQYRQNNITKFFLVAAFLFVRKQPDRKDFPKFDISLVKMKN